LEACVCVGPPLVNGGKTV